jgi:hypothetical protein
MRLDHKNVRHVKKSETRTFCGKLLSEAYCMEVADVHADDLCVGCRRSMKSPSRIKLLLAWRPEKHETGLARVIESPRGFDLYVNKTHVASVQANRVEGRQYKGWFWYARLDPTEEFPLTVKLKNTSNHPADSVEDAKKACRSYVTAELNRSRDEYEKSLEASKAS